NHDGSEVQGFPYIIGEKMKSGVALADIDGNGIQDIIFGTDGDNLYVLLDDLSIAEGFPIDLGSNLRSEPAVLNTGQEQIILIGCANDNFYGINVDGSLRFVVPTGDDIYTSPSFYETSDGIEIYFGSDDGNIYGLDIDGNNLSGYPLSISSGAIVGSVVFSDLNSDGFTDMIVVDDSGKIYGQSLDGQVIQGFPIAHPFPFSSSPQIVDYDGDGDLEVIVGSAGDLVNIDLKYQVSDNENYWTLFKGDYMRSGYYLAGQSGGDCGSSAGDINSDSIINILDIVMLVNSIIGSLEFSESENCAADLNSDDILNVLDIVELVNLVINS
ncbi:dockerin type I domain-containing protein, partial [Candidatus Marinimicrobia bacterium]|nr:dockerin type I domain-containing protein [Candidatus Neomarinimicrobiota bacterium]